VEALLQKAIAADPKLDEAYILLGTLYSARGDFGEAISAFQKAIEANPQSAEAHYRLGLTYKRTGEEHKSDQELQVYKQADKSETALIETAPPRNPPISDYSKEINASERTGAPEGKMKSTMKGILRLGINVDMCPEFLREMLLGRDLHQSPRYGNPSSAQTALQGDQALQFLGPQRYRRHARRFAVR